MNAMCDICGEPVSFGQPTDTTYRAFFHISTTRAACPTKDPNPMIHHISATATYVDDTKTASTQHAMCGALLGSYRDAVAAGHKTYVQPNLQAALKAGITCPGCLKRFSRGRWVSINDITVPVTIEASNGNRRIITHIERPGFGLPIVVFENGETSTWTKETRFMVVDDES